MAFPGAVEEISPVRSEGVDISGSHWPTTQTISLTVMIKRGKTTYSRHRLDISEESTGDVVMEDLRRLCQNHTRIIRSHLKSFLHLIMMRRIAVGTAQILQVPLSKLRALL